MAVPNATHKVRSTRCKFIVSLLAREFGCLAYWCITLLHRSMSQSCQVFDRFSLACTIISITLQIPNTFLCCKIWSIQYSLGKLNYFLVYHMCVCVHHTNISIIFVLFSINSNRTENRHKQSKCNRDFETLLEIPKMLDKHNLYLISNVIWNISKQKSIREKADVYDGLLVIPFISLKAFNLQIDETKSFPQLPYTQKTNTTDVNRNTRLNWYVINYITSGLRLNNAYTYILIRIICDTYTILEKGCNCTQQICTRQSRENLNKSTILVIVMVHITVTSCSRTDYTLK